MLTTAQLTASEHASDKVFSVTGLLVIQMQNFVNNVNFNPFFIHAHTVKFKSKSFGSYKITEF